MSALLRYVPIALYLPSTAGAAVFVKVQFETVSPFLLTFSTFIFCWILFVAINRRNLGRLMEVWRAERATVLKLNLYTLLSWVGIFACIQLLSASVELVVFMSIIPLVSVLASGEWRTIGTPNFAGVWAIAIISMVLVIVHPQMQAYGLERQLAGLAVGLMAGGFGALYIVLSGQLQKRRGLTSSDLVCLRLPLLLVATLLVSAPDLPVLASPDVLLDLLFLSAVAVVIPVWSMQQSIAKIGSVPTSVFMPLVPAVALAFEWGGGLPLSALGIAAIILQCAAIMGLAVSLAHARARLGNGAGLRTAAAQDPAR